MSFFRKISSKIKDTGIAEKIRSKLRDEEEAKRIQEAEAAALERARLEREEQERLYPMTETLRAYLTESGIISIDTFQNFDQSPAECQQFHLGVQELQHIELAERIIPKLVHIRHTLKHRYGKSSQHFWSIYFMLITQVVARHRRIPYSPNYFTSSMCAAGPGYRSRLTHFDEQNTPLGALGVAHPPGRLGSGALEDYSYEHPANLPSQQPPVPIDLAAAVRTAMGLTYTSDVRVSTGDLKRVRNAEVLMDERGKLWATLTGAGAFLAEQPNYFELAESRVFGISNTVGEDFVKKGRNACRDVVWTRPRVRSTLLFGGKHEDKDYDAAIGTSGRRDLRDILYMIAAEVGPEAFLPFLPDFVSLMLCAGMPKCEAYVAATLLLTRSFTRGGGIFPSGRSAQAEECERFAGCVAECAPGVAAALRRRGFDPGCVGKAWIDRFFVGILPLPTVLCVLDCFLADRSRAILFRVAVALFQLVPIDAILAEDRAAFAERAADISPKDLLRAAYSIPISSDVVAATGAAMGGDAGSDSDAFLCDTEDFPDISRSTGPDRLFGVETVAAASAARGGSMSPSQSPSVEDHEGNDSTRRKGKVGEDNDDDDDDDNISESKSVNGSNILNEEQFDRIIDSWLPRSVSTMSYRKMFATRRDGFSLSHLLRLCEGIHPVLIVVKSRAGNIFGAFVTAELAKTGDKYVGTGESFVFTLSPEPARYGWSKRNVYFLAVGPRSLVVGGGGVGAALELDDELCLGASFRSATFENEPLDGGRTEFVVEDLEIFGFVHGEDDDDDEFGDEL